MKICFLSQTANDLSEEYRKFFKDYDLHFITFKEKNKKALDYLPNSTWAQGRNRLWNLVEKKYDYYIFIDDDHEYYRIKDVPHLKWLSYPLFHNLFKILDSFEFLKNVKHKLIKRKCTKEEFFSIIINTIKSYSPDVLALFNISGDRALEIDLYTMLKGNDLRKLGWFDATFTMLSHEAATRLLPYDDKFDGWWSPQIPIYANASNIFSNSSYCILDIAVRNSSVNSYKTRIDLKLLQKATGKMALELDNKGIYRDKLWNYKENKVNHNFLINKIIKDTK